MTLLALAALVSADAPDRPNIVFAFADDWGRVAGVYAGLEPGGLSDAAKTPNVDRLAREGLTFTRAFVSAPSCTPCRSSLLSGRHFWQCGRASILLGAVWDGSLPSFPLLLEESGYHIGHTYKTWGPGTAEVHPLGGRRTSYTRAGGQFNQFSQNAMKAADREAEKARLIRMARENFADCLDDAEKAGKPFCYWFGPTNVHRKWVAGSGKELWGIDPDSLKGKVPPFLPDTPVVREDLADYLGEIAAFDAGLGELLALLDERGLAENTLVVVSGDHGPPGFSHGKCDLYDFGSAVPLLMRWPGKMTAGRVTDRLVSLPDLAPTFLDVAHVEKPTDMTALTLTGVMTENILGAITPAQAEALNRDAIFIGRERHVDVARPGELPYPMRAIRTRDYLYIVNFEPDRYPMGVGPGAGQPEDVEIPYEELQERTRAGYADFDASPTKAELVTKRNEDGMRPFFEAAFRRRPREELYDLRADPQQTSNVADASSHALTRDRLHARLMAELERTNDPRVSDDPVFEHPPFTGPDPAYQKRMKQQKR